jgi:hypothetical protein
MAWRSLSTGPARNARRYWAFKALIWAGETFQSGSIGGQVMIRTHGTLLIQEPNYFNDLADPKPLQFAGIARTGG